MFDSLDCSLQLASESLSYLCGYWELGDAVNTLERIFK